MSKLLPLWGRLLALLLVSAGISAWAATVTFEVGSATNAPGTTVTVPVKVSGFQDVTSIQFTLRWDPSVVRYRSIGDMGALNLIPGLFGLSQTNEGALALSWDDSTALGVTLTNGTAIFSVTFEVIGGVGQTSDLSLSDSPVAREVSINFDLATFNGRGGTIRVQSPSITPIISFSPSSLKVDGGRFGFTALGNLDGSYTVEFSSDLKTWNLLTTITNTGGTMTFSEPILANQHRFYRLLPKSL
jgi:hypothetical protein